MIRRLDEKKNSPQANKLVDTFAKNIIGQPEAKETLVYLIEKYKSNLYDRSKPLGSFLFLGPTGTGKTSVVEEFCRGVFGSPDFLMKVDCGEFQHSHEIAKLQGSPPGYLGHRETHAFFTNERLKDRRSLSFPFTVILWDEIEKGSDALWNLMLGILDKGRFTTGTNTEVDMKPTVHIMTSNVGMSQVNDEDAIGFSHGEHFLSNPEISKIAHSAARQKFMPEFIARLDKVVVFNRPTKEEIELILEVMVRRLNKRIEEDSNTPFHLYISQGAKEQLVVEGFNRRENARWMKKTLEERVAMPLARLISTAQIFSNDHVFVDYRGGEWRYLATTGYVANGLSQGQLEVPEPSVLQS